MADWILAIDFGTTSTAAAMRVGETIERIEIDGSPRMPSMVFWREGTGASRTGRLVLGQEADELSGLAPWCLERTPKRHIGDEFIRLGEKDLRVVDVIGATLRRVAQEAINLRGGEPPGEVRLTHPARWGRRSLDRLSRAAEIAGLGAPVFIPEPVAAATHFASERLSAGQYVAVYDLGGGTFDTAVLRRTESSFELAGMPGGDENLGGEDFDDRLYRYLGRQLAPEKWQSLRDSSERVWTQANRELLRNARKTKEFLSRSAQYEFYMPPPIDQELLASAETFRELIATDVEATVVELERTVRGAGIEPTQLSAIYLAGGSSRIPLVGRVIQQRLGQLPESLDDPKAVTVLGAARLPGGAVGAAAGPVQTDAPTPAIAVPSPPATVLSPPSTIATPLAAESTVASPPAEPRVAAPPLPPAQPPRRPAPPLDAPPPRQPPPEAGGSRRGPATGLILAALVVLAGIAAGALAAAGVFSSNSSSTQTVTSVTTTAHVKKSHGGTTTAGGLPAGTSSCGNGLSVGPNTSCTFAANVEKAYDGTNGGDRTVTAFSPATGVSYSISCTGANPHVCTGGTTNNASVYFTSGPSSGGSLPTPAGLSACDSRISVNSVTSCPFAQNVFVAYASNYHAHGQRPTATVTAFSPDTQITYRMRCQTDGVKVNCTGGKSAFVTFPLTAVKSF